VKTSSGKVVATYFPYLTVNRSIAGDVPVYLKFALKVTHPQRRFRQISLNSAAAVRAGRGVRYFERKFQGEGGRLPTTLASKNRVSGLSRDVVCVVLRLGVLIQYRRVSDEQQTHRQTDIQTHDDG